MRHEKTTLNEVRDFIEAYRRTWEAVINGAERVDALAHFFNVPCTMLSAGGVLSHFSDVGQIRAFNQSRLAAFTEGGAAKAVLRGVDISTLGDHAALVLVNWELYRSDGSMERAWRHYYSVVRTEADWKILLSTFQIGS